MTYNFKQGLLATSLLVSATIIAAPAHAQDQTQAQPGDTAGVQTEAGDADTSDENEVVVTGSRIARPDIEASVPVAIVSDQAIQATGAGNIQDVLADLPSVGANFSRSTSNFSTTANGQATVNLRNLGDERTLVLVDGRRFVAGLPGTSIVDLNSIPTDLIERVEVVTGGASAVYGSEAIAGVVNFVLKDRFDGFRIRSQATISDEGDAGRQYVSVTAGTSFADDRGHVIVYGQYDRDEGLRSRNRAFSAHDVPNRSSFAAQGLFSPSGAFGPGADTFTFDSANNLVPYAGANVHGYDRNQDRYLAVPVERYLGAFIGNFEISDGITAFVEAEYVKSKSRSRLEPQAVGSQPSATDLDINDPDPLVDSDGDGIPFNDTTPYLGIPLTNPFIPAPILAQIAALNSDGDPTNDVTALPFRRRSNDIFDRSNRNDRELWRVVAGFKGELGNGFNWEVYYNHGEMKDHTESETIFAPNYRNALDAVAGPGGPVCSINVDADPTNDDAACVPINIFGFNTVSPAAAAYVTNGGQLTTYDAKVKQDVFAATIAGNLLKLPGGQLAFAAGAEYRRESSSENFDEATNLGLTLGNVLADVNGKYNVKEAFVEFVAPILSERTGFHYLGLEGAVRYADYSTVGGVWSWKAGAEYAPIRDIRFRGVYAEATRAPNIFELFAAQSETFPAVVDPCDQREGAGDGAPITLTALPAACLANPAIAAAAAGPGFVYSTAQIQTINGFTGGNINLREETAKTLTVGAVFTPRFARNFSMTVDYYRIKVKNAIGIIGQQTSLDECMTGSGAALFCDNIIRLPNGIVQTINAINLNVGSYEVEGIDTQARVFFPIGTGRIDFSVYWNHLLKQNQTSFPGGPTQPELRQLDCYSCGRLGTGFRDKVFASATLSMDNWSFNWRANYLSNVFDDITDPDAIATGSVWYHDAQLRLAVGEDKRFEFYLGMNNIFDKKPPTFGDTNPVTYPGAQTAAGTYDLYGRLLYAGVDFKF